MQRVLVSSVAAVVVIAMSVSADGAAGGHGKPTAKSIFDKGHAATSQASARSLDEGDGDSGGVDADEAESVRLRGEFQQSITAAPARRRSRRRAGRRAERRLRRCRSRTASWDEVTNKPFLNDPVNRGANFGVGWGDVTGRMTALTHSGSVVYAAAASGGVWRSHEQRGAPGREVNAGLPRLSVGALATDPSDGSVWVGTGEANNASENQYGVGVYRLARGSRHLAAGRRRRAERCRRRTASPGSAATSTSPPATACTGAR